MFNFNNVSFTYKNAIHPTLDKVSLQIDKGSCTLITGLSGSGKSTLLKLMTGLIPRLYGGTIEGEILFGNKTLNNLSQEFIAQNIGYVSQNPRGQFFTTNTTSELVFPMENFGFPKDKMDKILTQISSLLDIIKLLDKDIFSLSSGEQQKIAIGCSLSLEAKLIILDEPSANLDFNSTKKLAELLLDLKNKGFTIIVVEHRFYYLKQMVDQVLLLKNKTVVSMPMDFLSSPANNLRKLDVFKNHIEFPYIKSNKVTILSAKEISYQSILKKLSFDIRVGDVIALIGSNGVGKTTLLKILSQIIRPNTGKFIKNTQYNLFPFLVMQEMDYQFFTESVDSELILGNQHTTPEQREKILQQLELSSLKKRLPISLSSGEKQRLLIAIAALSNTNLYLFDEPTSGLDLVNMERIATIIKTLIKNSAVIIASHDIEFICKTCNRVIALKQGQIIADKEFSTTDVTLLEDLFDKL